MLKTLDAQPTRVVPIGLEGLQRKLRARLTLSLQTIIIIIIIIMIIIYKRVLKRIIVYNNKLS